MYALNRAQIIGHLTEDPQVRQTPSGQSVGDLNIITKQTIQTATGKQVSTAYHNVVVWRGLADVASRFLKKGSQIFIAGRIQTDEWEDQTTGQKRYKTRITADDLIMLDPKTPGQPVAMDSMVGGALNQAEVIGNLTRDPELRQTPNGNSVVSFGVATNFSWKDKMGQTQERTEFHNVVAWDALAQSMAQSFKKGRKVYISGRLQTRSWETPDGQKRYTTELVAEKGLVLGVPNPELGAPGMNTTVSVSQPTPSATPAPDSPVVPQNPVDVPAVNYQSEVKPEDLPF